MKYPNPILLRILSLPSTGNNKKIKLKIKKKKKKKKKIGFCMDLEYRDTRWRFFISAIQIKQKIFYRKLIQYKIILNYK